MDNFEDQKTKSNVPFAPPLAPSVGEGIIENSRQYWQRVQDLFDQLLDGAAFEETLQGEPDLVIRKAAAKLFKDHQDAAAEGFLDEPIALVRQLIEPAKPQFVPGQTIGGRFTIERVLGSGGMGEVYLAFDKALHENVAIKTIRRDLSGDESIRRRFIAEIQNARQVTHPNVCRINDLFTEADLPFFSMKYLDGAGLSEWIRMNPPPVERMRVALELCQGLQEAHNQGILHCDFKPANVIMVGGLESVAMPVITDFGLARANTNTGVDRIQGGTAGYIAPELLAGGTPSIRSDIYALGRVLIELVPGSKLAQSCCATEVDERPAALAPVITGFQKSSRRTWLFGGLTLITTGAVATREYLRAPLIAPGTRHRIAINHFSPQGSDTARTIRGLLMIALRQSLVVTIVGDEWIRSILTANANPARVPAEHSRILAAAGKERIDFVAEGRIDGSASAQVFVLQIFQPADDRPVLELTEEIGGPGQSSSLADRISRRIRREFGESAAALSAGFVPLTQLTSTSGEAVALYFRGLGLYETADGDGAIALFDRAIALDSGFALAHLSRGIALAARRQWMSAIPSLRAAFDVRARVSDRERLWIESSYYNIIGDYTSSLASCRKLVTLFPEEAMFQRHTAFAYAASGRPADAMPYNARAVELDASGIGNLSELIVNRAEANQFDEALEAYRGFRVRGANSTLLDWGAGIAWMGKGELAKAAQSFEAMGSDAVRERWARLLACGPVILSGRFQEATRTLESDLAWDIERREQSHQIDRRIWLGHLEALMDAPVRAAAQAAALLEFEVSPATLEANRQAAIISLRAGRSDLATAALAHVQKIEREWPSTHSQGVAAHVGAMLASESAQSDLYLRAAGLWSDPPLLWTRCRWYQQRGEIQAALADADALSRQTGRILKRHFPGLLVLGWIERARCMSAMSLFADALRLYQRIEHYWLTTGANFGLIHEVSKEIRVLRAMKTSDNRRT